MTEQTYVEQTTATAILNHKRAGEDLYARKNWKQGGTLEYHWTATPERGDILAAPVTDIARKVGLARIKTFRLTIRWDDSHVSQTTSLVYAINVEEVR